MKVKLPKFDKNKFPNREKYPCDITIEEYEIAKITKETLNNLFRGFGDDFKTSFDGNN